MKNLALLVAMMLGMSLLAEGTWAHGENQPGPHGGFIRMPGAFHTEIKEDSPSRIVVYLLDMEWKNPTTKDSKLTAQLKRGDQTTDLSCTPTQNHFRCQLPKSMKLASGDEVIVKASRGGALGGPASYPYPFRLLGSGAHH